MPRRLVLLVLALPLAAVTATFLPRREPVMTPPRGSEGPPPAAGVTAPAVPAVRGIDAAAAPVQASKAEVAGYIAYPDGTWLPPLNGVQQAPPIRFHERAPFARVVSLYRDPTGRDWYEHENGVRSTTYLDSRGIALGIAVQPTASKPVLPDDR